MAQSNKPKKHRLPVFEASISSQGKDRHLHLPRRVYGRLDKMGVMGKKLKFTIVAEELESVS